jgi:hypothetical protein
MTILLTNRHGQREMFSTRAFELPGAGSMRYSRPADVLTDAILSQCQIIGRGLQQTEIPLAVVHGMADSEVLRPGGKISPCGPRLTSPVPYTVPRERSDAADILRLFYGVAEAERYIEDILWLNRVQSICDGTAQLLARTAHLLSRPDDSIFVRAPERVLSKRHRPLHPERRDR